MHKHTLVDEEGFEGQFVATPFFDDSAVVAYGADPATVLRLAKARGVDDPVIIYVPDKEDEMGGVGGGS